VPVYEVLRTDKFSATEVGCQLPQATWWEEGQRWGTWEVTAIENEFLLVMTKCSKVHCEDYAIEVCTWSGWIVWYVTYIPINLLFWTVGRAGKKMVTIIQKIKLCRNCWCPVPAALKGVILQEDTYNLGQKPYFQVC
jgi:hypothetical protein